jgi:hypothetical protein
LEVGDGFEDAASDTPAGDVEKKPSTALSQDADVGVKWNTQRG